MAESNNDFSNGEASASPAASAPLTFSIVKTGFLKNPEAMHFSGGRWFCQCEAFIMAVLVRHPTRGNFLFDTGIGTRIDEETAGNPFLFRKLLSYQKFKPVVEQLRDAGINPEEHIQSIIISHLHWDHVAGLNDFPHAQVFITKEEYDYGRKYGKRPAFIQEQFNQPATKWNWIEFNSGPYMDGAFDRSCDFFGDGSVVLVPLPGHTPGSIGMFLSNPSSEKKTPPILFSSDTTWSIEGFRRIVGRPWIVSKMGADADVPLTRSTINKIHQLMKKHPDMMVVPAHDSRVHASLAQFPNFQQVCSLQQ